MPPVLSVLSTSINSGRLLEGLGLVLPHGLTPPALMSELREPYPPTAIARTMLRQAARARRSSNLEPKRRSRTHSLKTSSQLAQIEGDIDMADPDVPMVVDEAPLHLELAVANLQPFLDPRLQSPSLGEENSLDANHEEGRFEEAVGAVGGPAEAVGEERGLLLPPSGLELSSPFLQEEEVVTEDLARATTPVDTPSTATTFYDGSPVAEHRQGRRVSLGTFVQLCTVAQDKVDNAREPLFQMVHALSSLQNRDIVISNFSL